MTADEKEGDDDRHEEEEKRKEGSKMRETQNVEKAGLTINYQYPLSSLKRWSTSVQSSYIDVTSASSYTARFLKNQKRKQITLNGWTIPKVVPPVQMPNDKVDSTVQQPQQQQRLRSAISRHVPFTLPYSFFIYASFSVCIPY